jgi:hypothetical protein
MHQLQTPGHRLPKMWPFFKVDLSKLSQNFYFYFFKKENHIEMCPQKMAFTLS